MMVIDSLENQLLRKPNYCCRAAVFAESSGSVVNNEGRAQPYFEFIRRLRATPASWQWLTNTMEDRQWRNFDESNCRLAAASVSRSCRHSRDHMTKTDYARPGK